MSGGCSSFRDCTTGRRNGSVSHIWPIEWVSADNGRLLKLYEKHLPAASSEDGDEAEINNNYFETVNGSNRRV